MKSRILAALAASCIVVFAWGSAGCESKSSSAGATISGKVLYKGRPLTAGDIAFHPKAADGIPYSCKINADGSFSGTLPAGTLGEVIVTVQTMGPVANQGRRPAAAARGEEMREKMLKEIVGKNKDKGAQKVEVPVQPVPEKYTRKATSPLTWTLINGPNTKDFDLTD